MRSKDGFYRKLYLGLFLAFLVLVTLTLSALLSLKHFAEKTNTLVAKRGQELFLALDLANEKTQEYASMPIYVLSGNEKALTEHNHARSQFLQSLDLIGRGSLSPEDRALLGEIRTVEAEKWNHAREGIELRRRGISVKEVNRYFESDKNARLSQLLTEKVNELLARKHRQFEDARAVDSMASRKILLSFGLASFVAVLLFLSIGLLLIRSGRRKLRRDIHEAGISTARKEAVEVVAHDLKNPLTAIRLGLQSLQRQSDRGGLEPARLARSLEGIRRSSESMERLITNLLDHSKIESGHFTLSPRNCEIECFVKEVAERHEALAAAKGLKLHARLPGEGRTLKCDSDRLEQVLSNLLGNAIKFTPAGGEIAVELVYRAGQAVISIRDTGPGMSQEQARHAFERYWQARDAAAQGTGLGLAIVKSIIDAHHGKIWVESVPGQGTTFTFTLALQENTPIGLPPEPLRTRIEHPGA